MIAVNSDYDIGEFDVLFRDGKMLMQEFNTNDEARDLGVIKATGQAEGNGVAFEVRGWKPEPKLWPHKKLYGVYKASVGKNNTFTFLELAFADHHITKLDEGLNSRYFVGISCADSSLCDFSMATPEEKQTS